MKHSPTSAVVNTLLQLVYEHGDPVAQTILYSTDINENDALHYACTKEENDAIASQRLFGASNEPLFESDDNSIAPATAPAGAT